MSEIAVKGYTDVWGKHGAAIYDHTGPKSYVQWTAPSTGGDIVGHDRFGLRNIDFIHAIGFTVSGSYFVVAKLSAGNGGNLPKATLIWYPIATIGTTQVAGATDLSGETIRLLVIGG